MALVYVLKRTFDRIVVADFAAPLATDVLADFWAGRGRPSPRVRTEVDGPNT